MWRSIGRAGGASIHLTDGRKAPRRGLKVVYTATDPDGCNEVCRLLERRGLTPGLLDSPEPPGIARARMSYKVRIAVPRDQARQARDVLIEWLASTSAPANELARRFERQVLVWLGLVGAAVVVLGLCGMDWGRAFVLCVFGSAAVAIGLARWKQVRRFMQRDGDAGGRARRPGR